MQNGMTIGGRMLTAVAAAMLAMTGEAMAAGTTIRIYTPFADADDAAQTYMDMITAYEQESGNMVEDFSGLNDEAWMEQMEQAVCAGEADVVVIPTGTALSYENLAPVSEILETAPQCGMRLMPAMREADGSILLSPVRINWEALYINTDVLEANGLELPETYEELLAVCAALSAAGVVPIANAPAEWAEYMLDCLALTDMDEDGYGAQASLDGAAESVMTLSAIGAFGSDPWNVTDEAQCAAWLAGEAAMRFDDMILAEMLPEGREAWVRVHAMPGRFGRENTKLAGIPVLGVGITRACWEDDRRREAALTFVQKMLSETELGGLVTQTDGAVRDSILTMIAQAEDCAGILYECCRTDFDAWTQSVIAAAMQAAQ